jgi:ABC-type nitrate/sulfonate/bicarbonate transport system substrate-binding protein
MHRHFFRREDEQVLAVPPLKGTRLLHRTSEVLAWLVSVLLSLAVFLGCDIPSARVFHVCTNQWPGYEPLYLARSLGYFNDKEVRLVEYSSASDCMRAFGNGTVEAAGLTLDEALQLAEDGIAAKIILVMDFSSSREIPGEIIDVLIVERDCAERFPREVESLRSAWHRALEYLRANPKDATERMAPRTKLSPAEFRNTLEDIRFPAPAENHQLLAGDSPGLLIPMRQLMETMVSHKLLRRPVAVKSLL